MLFAILFDGQDEMLAAAPAVHHHALGDQYWREAYSADVDYNGDCQTAYVEISDDGLIDRLSKLILDDRHLEDCRRQVNALILGSEQNQTITRAA